MLNRILSLIIVLIVIGGAGLFYMAPIMTFHDIRSAAESGDVQSLSKLIDFDKLRASLKGQLQAEDEAQKVPAPSVLNDPIGAAGKIIKDAAKSIGKSVESMIDPTNPAKKSNPVIDVDAYLTPTAILGLTYGVGEKANKFNRNNYSAKPPEPKMTFFSLDHARMTIGSDADGLTRMTFERKGFFNWQLVHVGLPNTQDANEKAPVAVTKSNSIQALSPVE